ncbi:uncharacterized protein LOC123504141 [Portunus trituberculatus]|uniref:uncharacterized protein LOC123504141 n=1 Tax=Portunus trituberculatus TaxID=210409 RepID=UPI001E1D00C9|nr:uncharacterized protein LOC123504141 [Portunus trituberculatus]
MSGIIIALLYIFMGGFVILMNVLSAFLLINKFPRSLRPLTIYETSDTIMAVLSSLGLMCDGCLYLNGQDYCSSCARYFLIHILLIFPVIISHFSVYGICSRHIQDSNEKFSGMQALQHTSTLIWTATAWLIALIFTMILWNGTENFLGPMAPNITSLTVQNKTRQGRGIVDNLWQYNSNEDWSSDYRESVIIGLIYGIVQGNITHTELQQFHGISKNDGLRNKTKNIIRDFHESLGISEEEHNKIFNYEKNNVENKNIPPENISSAQSFDKILSIPYPTKHENDTQKIENPFHKLYNQVYLRGSTTNPLVALHRDNSESEPSNFEERTEADEFTTIEQVLNDTSSSAEENVSLASMFHENMKGNLSKANTSILYHKYCESDSTIKICEIQLQPILWTVMLVVVMMVVPILAGARLVFGVAMNHYFCQSSVTAHSQAYFSLPRKVRYKVIVLFITTLACWTPVMIERVLYAWLQVDQLSSVPTSLLLFLLLLGHMQNLLRAVFYISHHRNEQARVSVLSNSEDSLSSQSNTPSRARVTFVVS